MNNIRVRLPRKLAKSVSGGVLAEVGRLNPVGAMGITLNMLPLHRITMTLSENDLPLAMHDLVEVYNHKGSVGIYRVTKNRGKIKKHRKIELSTVLMCFPIPHSITLRNTRAPWTGCWQRSSMRRNRRSAG